MEGASDGQRVFRREGIDERGLGPKKARHGRAVPRIEIAHQQGGNAAGLAVGGDGAADQADALDARLLALVVEVGIEHHKAASRFCGGTELDAGAHAGEAAAPADAAGYLGLLREPEVGDVLDFQGIGSEEDRAELMSNPPRRCSTHENSGRRD